MSKSANLICNGSIALHEAYAICSAGDAVSKNLVEKMTAEQVMDVVSSNDFTPTRSTVGNIIPSTNQNEYSRPILSDYSSNVPIR